MTLASLTEIVGVWVSALFTLAIFSFLFKDNPFYKLAEHIVVGVAAGYTLVITVATSLNDKLLDPLWKVLSNGGPFASADRLREFVALVIPLCLGIMMYMRLHPKTAWLGRISVSLFLGVGSGLAIPTSIQTFVIQPLRATLLPIVPSSWTASLAHHWPGSMLVAIGETMGLSSPAGAPIGWGQAINNSLIVAGTFCAIVYFFFSKEHKGATGKAAGFGIWVLMIGFGSTFGFTVMARVSLLVGRFNFLIHRWLIENLWRLIFPK